MHQKKISKFLRTFLKKYHSIPILLRKRPHDKHLRYVSYSIPLVCSLALLLIGGSLVVGDLGFGFNDSLVYADEMSERTNEVALEDVNTNISTLAATASLTLANPTASTSLNTTVEPGGVGYVSANVTYSASNIGDYAIRISYANGKTNPKNGSTTLGGADNKTPANMANNTWGYAWSTNTSVDQTTQTYNTVPVFGSPANIIAKTNVTDSINATGKIMFAAKFAENAPTGHYATSVLLSMVATPKTTYTLTYNANGGSDAPANQTTSTTSSSQSYTIPADTKPTLSGRTFLGWATMSNAYYPEYYPGTSITLTPDNASKTLYAVWDGTNTTAFSGSMQSMTAATCAAKKVGTSGTMTDSRGNTTYTVARLSDGYCWMTQNLRLAGGTSMNRTNTDLDSSVYTTDSQTYTLPATSSTFNDTKTTDSAGKSTYMNHQVYNATDNDYGAYYSWCAATAGTCQIGTYANIQPDTSQTGNPTKSPANTTAVPADSQATSSICPKGWRLPTGESSGEYQALYNNGKSSWTTNNSKNGYWIGAANATGGAFFPAAGYVTASGTRDIGSYGTYWSSTAYSVTNGYVLYFHSSRVYPVNDYGRCTGYSVRCVAR